MLHKIPGAVFGLLVGLGVGLTASSMLNDAINSSRERLITSQRAVIAYQGKWLEAEHTGVEARGTEVGALRREIMALTHKADAYGGLIETQRHALEVRDRLLDERAQMIRVLMTKATVKPSPEANQPEPQGSR
jgi:hypothetical protein